MGPGIADPPGTRVIRCVEGNAYLSGTAAFLRASLAVCALAIPSRAIGTVRPPFLDPPSRDASLWRAPILEIRPGLVIIDAGKSDGLRPGERLKVVRPGPRIRPRPNLILQLPSDDIARLEVLDPRPAGTGREGTACAILEGDSIALSDRVERENPR